MSIQSEEISLVVKRIKCNHNYSFIAQVIVCSRYCKIIMMLGSIGSQSSRVLTNSSSLFPTRVHQLFVQKQIFFFFFLQDSLFSTWQLCNLSSSFTVLLNAFLVSLSYTLQHDTKVLEPRGHKILHSNAFDRCHVIVQKYRY